MKPAGTQSRIFQEKRPDPVQEPGAGETTWTLTPSHSPAIDKTKNTPAPPRSAGNLYRLSRERIPKIAAQATAATPKVASKNPLPRLCRANRASRISTPKPNRTGTASAQSD